MSNPSPSAPLRTRVTVPLASPPRLSPSLIPLDVLREAEREAAEVVSGEDLVGFDASPRTPSADNVAILSEVPATVAQAVRALSSIQLFQGVALEALVEGATLVDVPDGEVLFEEGEAATSFYVVMEGTFEVVRRQDGKEVALRHKQPGDALGLFGLFTARLRAATARAVGNSSVLAVPAVRLQALLEQDDELNERLLRYYKERLVEGFVALRIFSDVDNVARARIAEQFKSKSLQRGDALINQGEVTNLMALVTHGKVLLETRPKLGAEPTLLDVLPGQFVISLGALSGWPASLRVFAPAAATVELISHKDFAALLNEYPALRVLAKRMPGFGKQVASAVYCGSAGIPGT